MILALALSTITCLSVDPSGVPGNGGTNGDGVGSENPSISADGRFVAFDSEADNLVPGDMNGMKDIFLRDTLLGTTTCITFGANSLSQHPAISGNGRFVAFWSDASNLVPGDSNALADVFVYDRVLATIEKIGPGASYLPTISYNGRYVAYESWAATGDIYVRDRRTGVDERITVGDNWSRLATISPDGRWVGFSSLADDLVPNDNNGTTDSFLYDRQTDTLECLTLGADNGSDSPIVAAGGRYVVFNSYATNLTGTALEPFTWRCYLKDKLLGTIEVIAEGVDWIPAITPDGRYIAFDSLMTGHWRQGWNVFVLDRITGITERISTGPGSSGYNVHPCISDDGKRVAWFSGSPFLVSGDTNSVTDVFCAVKP